jgi:KGK domain
MHDRFESLASGEVISVQHDTQVLGGQRTFRVGELNEAIEGHLKSAIANWSEAHNGWFTPQGIDCEALRFGSQGWQKGRIRLCLEFCPDEPNSAAQGTTASSIPTVGNLPSSPSAQSIDPLPPPHSVAATTPESHADLIAVTAPASALPPPSIVNNSTVDNSHPLADAVVPAAGIAAVGVMAAAAMTPADLHHTDTHQIIPHFAETTLEQEEDRSEPSIQHSIDEIAYNFNATDAGGGNTTPNGMMELDLADLGLDFSDSDLLSFETGGITESSEEFLNIQDHSKPENSGMLIDEVWNEMNQGNWPGIN